MAEAVTRVAVLGIGTLGSQIAYHAAFRGMAVVAYDVDEPALAAARRRLDALPGAYVEDGIPGADATRTEAARASVRLTTDLEDAVAGADLVIEAAPELVEVKRELLAAASRAARPDAVIATNTSYMLPSDLAASVHLPGRFLALHFANRIRRYRTAEIMPSPLTEPGVVEATRRYAEATGMLPVVMTREKSGYVLNSLLAPMMSAAVELLLGGYADVRTVDATWRTATGSPYGPFEIYDIIGLRQARTVASTSSAPAARAWAAYLQEEFLRHGRTGVESGRGFSEYPRSDGSDAPR